MPGAVALLARGDNGREVALRPHPDEWLARLARIPLLYQPGEAWLYDTCSDLQGILIARVSGLPLPQFLAERVFAPLGMRDTGYTVPAAQRQRFTSYYRRDENGLVLVDGPDGQFAAMPAFPAGAGGLVGTVDDWFRFARMLVEGGAGLLTPESVRQMTTDHLTDRAARGRRVVPRGSGLGLRRLGRHRHDRTERPRELRATGRSSCSVSDVRRRGVRLSPVLHTDADRPDGRVGREVARPPACAARRWEQRARVTDGRPASPRSQGQ